MAHFFVMLKKNAGSPIFPALESAISKESEALYCKRNWLI